MISTTLIDMSRERESEGVGVSDARQSSSGGLRAE